MTIEDFAERERVHTRRGEDGVRVVAGKFGDIYEYDDRLFAVSVMMHSKQSWTYRKKRGLGVGMTLQQDGDEEGTMLFDPENPDQSQAALTIAHVRRRMRLSAELIERKRKIMLDVRRRLAESPDGKGTVGPQTNEAA